MADEPPRDTAALWTPEIETYVKTAYVGNNLAPRLIVGLVKEKYGVEFNARHIHNKVAKRGWRQIRKAAKQEIAKLGGPELESPTVIARKIVRSNQGQMEAWRERSRRLGDKAFDMADRATTPRDLASSTAAIKSIVGTFRQCAGMDNSGPGNGSTFNFNFAVPPPTKLTDVSEAVDV